VNSQLKQKMHGSPVDASPTAAERYPDAQTIPEYMKDRNQLLELFRRRKGRPFSDFVSQVLEEASPSLRDQTEMDPESFK
jgi:hypothetical protein